MSICEGTYNFEGFGHRVFIDQACFRDETKVTLWGENNRLISTHTITVSIDQLRRFLVQVEKEADEERRKLEEAKAE
jgi:hypothetical protein